MAARVRTYVDDVRETVSETAIVCQTYGHMWDPKDPTTEVEWIKGAGGRMVGQIERLRCLRCHTRRRFDKNVSRDEQYVYTIKRAYDWPENYRRPKRAADDDGPTFTRGNAQWIYFQQAFPGMKW